MLTAQGKAYRWQQFHWHHSNGLNTCEVNNVQHRAMPKEYCVYVKNDSDECLRAVKHEDIAAGLFACGFHMRQEVADKERRELNLKHREERAQREEVEQWEIQVYEQAEAYLRTVLSDELFGENHCYRKWSSSKSLVAEVRVDWFELKQAVQALVEKVHGERTD